MAVRISSSLAAVGSRANQRAAAPVIAQPSSRPD
jgi:hypothetical protein